MKKIFALGLAALTIAAVTCTAYATAARYVCIRQFTFDGEVTSTSAYGETYASLSGRYDSETVITLERSTDGGRTFRKYKVLESKNSSSSSYSASGETSGLSSSYDYRLKAELTVYDASGNEIDYAYDYIG